MAHNVGSGDKLARGAVRATYMVRDEVSISDKKWKEMFGDFDPAAFKAGKPSVVSGTKETTKRNSK